MIGYHHLYYWIIIYFKLENLRLLLIINKILSISKLSIIISGPLISNQFNLGWIVEKRIKKKKKFSIFKTNPN